MQAYSDPSRENHPFALPDIEVFHVPTDYDFRDGYEEFTGESEDPPEGYYWWVCFPGCLPDGEPNGPFDTEEEALADAQNPD